MSILLAGPGAHESRLRAALPRGHRAAPQCPESRAEVLAGVEATEPLVVILGPALEQEAALGIADTIDLRHPDVVVVLLAPPNESLFQRAAQAGVREVVAPNASEEEVHASVARALDAADRRRQRTRCGTGVPPGRVVTVLSPKGGVGKTAIASNLAAGLAHRSPGSTVIVDCDLQFGDVAHALCLTPEHTMADVARATGKMDSTTIKAFLTLHGTGLYALCAPGSPIDADDVHAGHVHEAIGLLATQFRHVVVDTAAGLDMRTFAAAEHATDIVLVCGTERNGAISLRRQIEAIDELGLTGARRHFVLNRSNAKVGLKPSDVTEIVGMEATILLPSAREVPLAMNQGVPLRESSPRSPATRALEQLVTLLEAGPELEPAYQPDLLPLRAH